jgi:hypothetical protein
MWETLEGANLAKDTTSIVTEVLGFLKTLPEVQNPSSDSDNSERI